MRVRHRTDEDGQLRHRSHGVRLLSRCGIACVLARKKGSSDIDSALGKSIECVGENVMAQIVTYHWPGNIRGSQNFIEHSVILTKGEERQAPIIELANKGNVSGRTLADAERTHIVAALGGANWVIGGFNGAAARLRLKRTTVIAKMQKCHRPLGCPSNILVIVPRNRPKNAKPVQEPKRDLPKCI